MKKCFLLITSLSLSLLTGCAALFDNTRFYDGSIPQESVRWPDDVPTCWVFRDVFMPLQIMVSWSQFRSVPICPTEITVKSPVEFHTDRVKIESARMGVDSSQRVRRFHAYYRLHLEKISEFEPSLNYTPDWTRHIPGAKSYPDIWQYNRPLPVKDKTVVINGLTWEHHMFYRFYSHDADPSRPAEPVTPGKTLISYDMYPLPVIDSPHPDALTTIGEVYIHKLNANYQILIWANYDRTVTQDAHWLKVRRAMLRKLVNRVTITPLTPQLIRQLRVDEQAQKKYGW